MGQRQESADTCSIVFDILYKTYLDEIVVSPNTFRETANWIGISFIAVLPVHHLHVLPLLV